MIKAVVTFHLLERESSSPNSFRREILLIPEGGLFERVLLIKLTRLDKVAEVLSKYYVGKAYLAKQCLYFVIYILVC